MFLILCMVNFMPWQVTEWVNLLCWSKKVCFSLPGMLFFIISRFLMSFGDYVTTLTMLNLDNMDESPINFLAFIKILSIAAWLFFFFACVILALGYVVLHMSEGIYINRCCSISLAQNGLLSGMGFIFRSIIQVDGTCLERTLSWKLFFLTMAIFSHIFFAYYNAILTSFMTVREPAPGMPSTQNMLFK